MNLLYKPFLLLLFTLCIATVTLFIIRKQVSSSNTTVICCAAGKSGGHILPCLTMIEKAKIKNPSMKLLFFSDNSSLDHTLLARNPLVTYHIPFKLESPTQGMLKYPTKIWYILRACIDSMYYLYKYSPTKIVTTGGITSVPVCIVAWILGIPIELHELNAIPGKASCLIAPYTHIIHTYFTKTKDFFKKYHCVQSDYPIRFHEGMCTLSAKDACNILGLKQDKKTIFIIGGSQGSLLLSAAIKQMVETYDMHTIQIIHQTGTSDKTDWKRFYTLHNIIAEVFTYRHDIVPCYKAADLIISRAGAGSLFEIAFFKKPSIIIPLEADTTDHQVDNAYAFQSEHPAICTVMRQHILAEKPQELYDLICTKLIPAKF